MARLLVSSALATVIWSVTSGYFHLGRIQANSCPPAERASLESFVRNRIHCAAICEMERPCQGFCYNNVLKKCRTYRILLADAFPIAVNDIGYSMYWSAYVGKTRFGRSLYYLKSDPGDFIGATTACGNDQAKVATPTDAAENEFIRSLSPPDLDIWIGINQLPGDGDWINQVTGE
ncbi:uncharacterized protein LOC135204074 isoform X2 [Macrobrachium nipponense]|uniref:uncharacterized protein LOC135204074 isoform X2 n=1 Tax=Macrobrachium nipponense TaxID=159736 RepID=UPI0030C871D4